MPVTNNSSRQIYFRLVALWAVCEAMLGGVIHGLKLPVSGLIVGSGAILCICMLAKFYPVRGSILKATLLVAIFKMMLSPQSPIPAYLAVLFQGMVGQIIFSNNKNYRLKCILFGMLAMLESALQRILILTILFGMEFWKAINLFISGITGQDAVTNYSYYLVAGYILLHLVSGYFIGIFAAGISAGKIHHHIKDHYKIDVSHVEEIPVNRPKKKHAKKIFLLIVWLGFIVLYLQSKIHPEDSLISRHVIAHLLYRSGMILLTWIVIINPILSYFLHEWLKKKQKKEAGDFEAILNLIPQTQELVLSSWKLSGDSNGLKRVRLFFRILFYNSLLNE